MSLKIFEVSAHSFCGTYFMSYLKFAVIVAESEEEARKLWKQEASYAGTADGVTPSFTEVPFEKGVLYSNISADY